MKKTNYSIEVTDNFVSIVNNLIEAYCNKYPDEFEFDNASIGYDPKTGEITCANGDDLNEILAWVNSEIIPAIIER